MKYGICSEIFAGWDFEKIFEYLSSLGYDGLEIAPFNINPYVDKISRDKRYSLTKLSKKYGVEIIGLHWLLKDTEGFHITHKEKEIRERTIKYFLNLIDFCGDIEGKIMVIGSPKQRTLEGISKEEGEKYFIELIEKCLPLAEKRDVTLCLEPLGSNETNFVNNAEDAINVIKKISNERFKLILDVKAMYAEEKDIIETIKKSRGFLKHFHVNDRNLSGPGFGDVDFKPIIEALKSIDYNGYLSVEVFNFEIGAEKIAEKSLEYLRAINF